MSIGTLRETLPRYNVYMRTISWVDLDQIEVSKLRYAVHLRDKDRTYVARIRCFGLTAYGETYAAAVEKVVRMRQSYLNVKEAING